MQMTVYYGPRIHLDFSEMESRLVEKLGTASIENAGVKSVGFVKPEEIRRAFPEYSGTVVSLEPLSARRGWAVFDYLGRTEGSREGLEVHNEAGGDYPRKACPACKKPFHGCCWSPNGKGRVLLPKEVRKRKRRGLDKGSSPGGHSVRESIHRLLKIGSCLDTKSWNSLIGTDPTTTV